MKDGVVACSPPADTASEVTPKLAEDISAWANENGAPKTRSPAIKIKARFLLQDNRIVLVFVFDAFLNRPHEAPNLAWLGHQIWLHFEPYLVYVYSSIFFNPFQANCGDNPDICIHKRKQLPL
jgi:hypothetical protein